MSHKVVLPSKLLVGKIATSIAASPHSRLLSIGIMMHGEYVSFQIILESKCRCTVLARIAASVPLVEMSAVKFCVVSCVLLEIRPNQFRGINEGTHFSWPAVRNVSLHCGHGYAEPFVTPNSSEISCRAAGESDSGVMERLGFIGFKRLLCGPTSNE